MNARHFGARYLTGLAVDVSVSAGRAIVGVLVRRYPLSPSTLIRGGWGPVAGGELAAGPTARLRATAAPDLPTHDHPRWREPAGVAVTDSMRSAVAATSAPPVVEVAAPSTTNVP